MDKPRKKKPSRFKKVILDITPLPSKHDDEMDSVLTLTFNQLWSLILKSRSEDYGYSQEEVDDGLATASSEFKKSFKAYFDDLLSRKGNKSDE